MHRRSLLATAAFAPIVALLPSCTVSTAGGVTTVTLNVASVDAWGQAVINAAGLIMGAPGVATLTGPYAVAITAALAAASADLKSFDLAADGAVTVTYNGTSAGAAVLSLLSDAQKLFSTFQTAIGGQLGTLGSTVSTYLSALQTVVSLIQAAISAGSGAVTAAMAPQPMTEAQALEALGVTPPAAP